MRAEVFRYRLKYHDVGKCTLKSSSTGCIQLSEFPEFYTRELCIFLLVNCSSIKKLNTLKKIDEANVA